VHAVLVGEGPEREPLIDLTRRLSVTERTHFLGQRDDVEVIHSAFDVFCLPSVNEGLPRSVLEAQACGVPVVASTVGGVPSAVCPNSGRLVPAGDDKGLAAALADVIGRRIDKSVPRSFIERRFSLEGTREAYERLIAGPAT
jgi:glycosyltransferase involved in cell wall biosynthesis